MKIGFIMVNYNDYDHVKNMLNQIETYSIIDTIIIIDNCSTDDSLTKLKQLETDKVKILINPQNSGYGAGINMGVRYLNQKYENACAFISNTDILIESEQELKQMIMGLDEITAVVGPIIEEHSGYNCGWKVPTPWQDILLSIPHFYKKYQKKMHYDKKDLKEYFSTVEAVSGSFFLLNCKDLERANYFDEQVFLYYEENILAKKMQVIHKKIKIATQAKVFHNHSVTIDQVHTNVQKYKNLKKSQYYFQTQYNHAGIMNRFTMKILFKLVEISLVIRNHIRR